MRTKWIVYFAAVLHLFWAAMLIRYDPPSRTTALHFLTTVFGFASLTALCLLGASLLSLTALNRNKADLLNLCLFLPQQILMILSAGGAISAMIEGRFADGVLRPSSFIIADQIPPIFAMIFHTCAISEEYFRRWLR